jgi:hypothetical protein
MNQNFSTGQERIDRILDSLTGMYRLVFPQRIRACYLTGSFTDGSATPDSDIDLVPVFAGELRPGEAERIRDLTRYCEQLALVLLDCSPTDERTQRQGVKTPLKSGRLLYGEPVLDDWPLEPLEDHMQRCMFIAFRYMQRLRGDTPLRYPLDYPDRDGPFFGYERFGNYLGGQDFGPGLRIIVSAVTMMTSTLLALHDGAQVGSKQQSIDQYRGQWSDLTTALYTSCKFDWQNQIPADPAEQRRLRALCGQLLALENDFIDQCRARLLGNLHHERDLVRHFATESLKRIAVES